MAKTTNPESAQGLLFSQMIGDSLEETEVAGTTKTHRFSANLISQGVNRFYTLTMPVDILAANSTVDVREDNPATGFQRKLDRKRAESIAHYIQTGHTIPCSIILSAQSVSEFKYDRPKRTVSFKENPAAFLILDGQHRVFGFSLIKTDGSVKREDLYRVPVVIYTNLSRFEECQLFIDINTNQRPVPNELLLDIKRLAQTETDIEVILHDLFAQFADDPSSPLLGCLSPASKTHGKISKVTFYAAAAPAIGAFEDNDSGYMYSVLSSYLHAWMTVLRQIKAESSIVNPTLFRAVLLLFRDVATRANDRHPGELNNVDHFVEFIEPLVGKVKKTLFIHPGRSHKEIYDHFASALKQQVSLGRKK